MRVGTKSSFILLLAFSAQLRAASWEFSYPLEVSRTIGDGIFHHLGSGGRNAIAVSAGTVGLVWEDNRDGEVRCYLARRDDRETVFNEVLISGGGACYEPAVVAVESGMFAVAWEEDNAVWIRLARPGGLGPRLRLSDQPAGQVVLATTREDVLVAAWVQKEGKYRRVRLARIEADGNRAFRVVNSRFAEDVQAAGDQSYPDLIALDGGRLLLAWEDRRKGHTVILVTEGSLSLDFRTPKQVNESFWGGRALGYGRGTGATRVSLASPDGGQAVAVWADKRNFRSGYDIFAAVRPAGPAGFGGNEQVQDSFGDLVAQWHPEVAAGRVGKRSLVVAAWDDDREGTLDIWLSLRTEGQWSDDLEVPGASGEGVQVEPALALDAHGRLHLAWVEKQQIDGPTRIRYLSGTPHPDGGADATQ